MCGAGRIVDQLRSGRALIESRCGIVAGNHEYEMGVLVLMSWDVAVPIGRADAHECITNGDFMGIHTIEGTGGTMDGLRYAHEWSYELVPAVVS